MSSFEVLLEDLVDAIDGVNRYNPENVPSLEKCVRSMVAETKYDRNVCLTLLKLYQLNPDKWDEATVQSILMKSLMELPAPDFALAKSLIDANRLVGATELKRVLNLGSVLESCNFALFWKLMRGEQDDSDTTQKSAELRTLVAAYPGFEEAVRVFVCRVIAVTYQHIAKDTVSRLLGGLQEPQLCEFAQRFGWELKPDSTFFVANHEGTIKTRNIDEKLQFRDVTEILKKIAVRR